MLLNYVFLLHILHCFLYIISNLCIVYFYYSSMFLVLFELCNLRHSSLFFFVFFSLFLFLSANLHCLSSSSYSSLLFVWLLFSVFVLFVDYYMYVLLSLHIFMVFHSFLLCNIGVQPATLKWSLITLEQDQLFINMLKCFTVCCIHLYKLILAIRPIWTMCIVQALAIGQIRGPMGGGLCKYF